MTTKYRCDWIDPEDDSPNPTIHLRHFGENLKSAQQFARRKSSGGLTGTTLMRQAHEFPTVYVIKSVDDRDVCQWVYWMGHTYGCET